MPRCPNCGKEVTPLPSLPEVEADAIMASLQAFMSSSTMHAHRANAELLEHIADLWEKNRALQERVNEREAVSNG